MSNKVLHKQACLTPLLLLVGAASLGLTGCGTVASPAGGGGGGGTTLSGSGTGFTVKVLAGADAISGASVQLYAAGSTGNGSGATALLAAALTTDSNGNATVPAGYTCPSSSTPLFLVSSGGRVGAAASANNAIRWMAALPACNSLASQYVVNEATTLAAAFALAPFYAAGGGVGATATNNTGLLNAFATATELAEPTTGAVPGLSLPGNVAAPTARLNALSNALHACAENAASCATLFTLASPASGTLPVTGSTGSNIASVSNTLDALHNLVLNPAGNVATLYTLSTQSPVFTPALTAAPTDWTLYLTIGGGGMNAPSGLGVDSTGSLWVASYFGVLSRFNPLGAPSFASGITGSGLGNSYGLAVDSNDNAWVPNETGSVSEITTAGASLAGTRGYTAGGMNYPIAVAIDPNTTVWVLQYGNSHITLLNSSGVPQTGSTGVTSPLFAFPVAVALDGNHYGWVANQSGSMVTRVAPDGSSFTNYNCCNGASGIAVDAANNVWVANFYGNSVSQISSSGAVLSTGYTGQGSLNHPQAIAVDGAGNLWVANYRAAYLTELAGANTTAGQSISPPAGFGADAGLLEAYAIAVDASGSVWVSNFGSNTVTRFLGVATPVRTPLLGTPRLP